MWSLVAGFFLSPAIALILQCDWSRRKKAAVAFSVYVAVAVGSVYYGGRLDLEQWPTTVLAVIATAVSGYTGHRTLWHPTGIAPAIENATSWTVYSEDIEATKDTNHSQRTADAPVDAAADAAPNTPLDGAARTTSSRTP